MFVTLNRACFEFYGCKDRNVSFEFKIIFWPSYPYGASPQDRSSLLGLFGWPEASAL